MHHSIELVKAIGRIMDYIFLDGYEYENIFSMFASNTSLIKTILLLINENMKLKSLRMSYSSKNLEEGNMQLEISFTFSKILFKMITNQNPQVREVFLQENGITLLKSWLNTFQEKPSHYELYLYSLGMVPPLLTIS